MGRRNTKLEPT